MSNPGCGFMKASDLIRSQNSDAKKAKVNKDKTDSSTLDDIWDSAMDTHTPQDAEREPLGDLEGFEDGDCDDNQGCSFLEEEEFGVEEYSEGEIEMHEDAKIDDGVKEEDTAKESNKRSKLTKMKRVETFKVCTVVARKKEVDFQRYIGQRSILLHLLQRM